MQGLQYIFIREDGQTFGIACEPTNEDLAHAKYGLVTILRTADLHCYGRAGRWEIVPEGVLASPDQAEAPSDPFHMPPHY